MAYYINSKTGRKKRAGKVWLYILAYVLVFAISFFISFKLVASTQTGAHEIEALKVEISELTSQLAAKQERISSLEMQIKNIQQAIAEQQAAAEAAAQANAETMVQ